MRATLSRGPARRVALRLPGQQPAEEVEPAVDVDEAGRERRHPEADRVGRAEVGDDAGSDEPLAEPRRVRVADGDVAASPRWIAGAPEAAAERHEPRVVQGDGVFGEGRPLLTDAL